MYGSMADIQSAAAGEEKEEEEKLTNDRVQNNDND